MTRMCTECAGKMYDLTEHDTTALEVLKLTTAIVTTSTACDMVNSHRERKAITN